MQLLSVASNQCKTLLSLFLTTITGSQAAHGILKITSKTIINLSSYQLSDKPNQVLTLRFASHAADTKIIYDTEGG